MEKSIAALSDRAEKMVSSLERKWSENESRKRKLNSAMESVVERMRVVEDERESLEKRARDLKERERAILASEERKKKEFASEEEGLGLKREMASKRLKRIKAREESLKLDMESLLKREKKVNMIIGALDGRISAVEEKEKEFGLFKEGKMRDLALKEERLNKKWREFAGHVRERKMLKNRFVKRIELAENKLDAVSLKIDERFEEIEFRDNAGWESLALSVKEADLIRESVEKKMVELERMKTEFNAFQEEKIGELASKEQLLLVMSEELAKDTVLRNEQLMEREELGYRLLQRLEWAKDNVEGMRRSVRERFEEIELRMRELASKEQLLDVMSRELIRDVELRNEQLMKGEKLGHQLLERLVLAKDEVEGLKSRVHERFIEIGLKETELESIRDWVERKMDETDLKAKEFEEREERIGEKEDHLITKENELQGKEKSLLVWEKELEDKQKEFDLARKSSEELLDVMSRELMRDAELRNEQLIEREKLGLELLERLSLAKDNVEALKRKVHERSVKIGLKETELESICDWVERKMNETDLKAEEFGEREERIAEKEYNLISKEKELQGKEKSLLAWQKGLEDKQREVDLARKSNDQQLVKLDSREKNLNSVRDFTRNCFKEHLAIKRKLLTEKDLVEQSARDLVQRSEHLNNAQKDLEFREKQMRDVFKELELKQQLPLKIEQDECADLKFTLRMDGKTLQMFLNDPEKELESMGDEIFKVLPLSSDPAKLVLDAMVGFYPPRLRKEDRESNVRRICITLLEQLIKMSPNIKPHVREEAIQLATSWKSKMRGTGANAKSLEVLGFLLLLSAFDLASYFDKDEISSFLMMVDQHRETPEWHCVLGFAESTSGSF